MGALFIKAVVYHKNFIVGAQSTENYKKENVSMLNYSQ